MSDGLVFLVLNMSLFLLATGLLLTMRIFRSPRLAREIANPHPNLARQVRH
jgi:hypothetical protein